jgi:hypothetical protein
LFFPGPAACQEDRGTPVRGEATQFNYTKSHSFPDVFSPYIAPFVPEPRLDTSRRLQNLIVDGKLNLKLDDVIALALENNMEIAVARYDLPIAQTDMLREKEGGATRGVAVLHPFFRSSLKHPNRQFQSGVCLRPFGRL